MSNNRFSTSIKGAAGEFYIASYLSALGLVVALPRAGVPTSDLLVTTQKANKTISLQVKTSFEPQNRSIKYTDYYSWDVSRKSLEIKHTSHWYAFVNLHNWPNVEKSGAIFFVPSADVASLLEKNAWNKEDAPRLFFPIFTGINDYSKKLVENYQGIEGFNLLMAELDNDNNRL